MAIWDEQKRNKVIANHGVDFAKIRDVFEDPFSIYIQDSKHSENEERWVVIGRTAQYGLVSLTYTLRGDDIRFITARRAEKWMVKDYEKQRKRT